MAKLPTGGQAGANVGAKDVAAATPLHYAAAVGHDGAVRTLLQRGAAAVAAERLPQQVEDRVSVGHAVSPG